MGVSVSTIRNWIHFEGLPARRTLGGHFRCDPRRVRDFLQRRNVVLPPHLVKMCARADLMQATAPLED